MDTSFILAWNYKIEGQLQSTSSSNAVSSASRRPDSVNSLPGETTIDLSA